ncbi:ribosome assembly factor SBDS [Methanocorpusculum vombati]|uniref:Ribosome assembly factor SBDS n=1 Tax=Methanocorpusculum vombati TaxID=3002864 RepID=A0ABT4ILZ2_9EURY|nr:ribosome assembly factor SBDS [Methanocorpusculum vombati]MCZ9312126.1 ribosome assembly factor SBDS [Methanocorpusculum sp.]MCZ0862778.1 ribosome assembly factor SBDS [Methanocorpusculum vombati]MDE2520613.1 ribosome assembly factor SBDS [Methanocorpusculum sp.]MDE2534150.1 ribosome assembly factor SBDS [Methanocorpusculum sp.]MDE2545426.1 ribosome assembly factor SBDS [Methanocorpusculum sp.]
MISLDDAVTARLETHGLRFEILVDPELADKMRHGDESIAIEDAVAALYVYENASHGDKSPEEDLEKVFKTTVFEEIAKQIILKGEIHLTTEQRRRLMEEKRRRVITFIARNAVNPQTGLPHPATRIELALEEVRINFDPFKSVDELVKETVKALRPILPIRFEERKIAVRFPMDFAARAFGAVSGAAYVTMEKNEWQNDGSWICVVRIPAGMQEEFFSLANHAAKGDAQIKILE